MCLLCKIRCHHRFDCENAIPFAYSSLKEQNKHLSNHMLSIAIAVCANEANFVSTLSCLFSANSFAYILHTHFFLVFVFFPQFMWAHVLVHIILAQHAEHTTLILHSRHTQRVSERKSVGANECKSL